MNKLTNPCWYCTDYDVACPIDLRPGRHGYQYNEEHGFNPHTTKHGIQWEYEGRIIRLQRNNQILYGCYGWPSPAMDKMVIVHPINDKVFSAPRNLVVYNPDGSIHCRPQAPITCAPDDEWPYIAPKQAEYFYSVHWRIHKGEIALEVQLDMGLDMAIENRIFNPYTGECEDFVGTWRL